MDIAAVSSLSYEDAARVLALPAERIPALLHGRPLLKAHDADSVQRSALRPMTSECCSELHHHAVQFYESEDFLCDCVADYVADGLAIGAPIVIIARPARLQAFTARIEEHGQPAQAAIAEGRFVLLDAFETLAGFMRNGMPDAELFTGLIQPVLDRLHRAYPDARLRAYGEMVDILWAQDNADAALQLEALWNELSRRQPFSLLCAYGMDRFRGDLGGRQFERVCQAHSEVAPTESVTPHLDLAAQRRETARMQQRIAVLEDELWRVTALRETPQQASAVAQRALQTCDEVVSMRAVDAGTILVFHHNAHATVQWIKHAASQSRSCNKVLAVETELEALAMMEFGGIELCLCVIDSNSDLAASRLLAAVRLWHLPTPFVATADPGSADLVRERLILSGFDDVVSTDALDERSLGRIVRNAHLRGRRVQRLHSIGTIDELTGVLNRRGFIEHLEIARQRCEQLQLPLSLMYLDLNDFKQVNDSYGHKIGDEAIRMFAFVVQRLLRRTDMIGRIGGDEFAVACPGVAQEASEYLVQRLHERLRLSPVKTGGDGLLLISASVGIHRCEQLGEISCEELLAQSDAAMYRDKRRRRSALPEESPLIF